MGPVEELQLHVAMCAFYDLSLTSLAKIASKLDIEIPPSVPLFDLLWQLIQGMLGVTDDETLMIMQQRTIKERAVGNDKVLKHFDELQEVMSQDEKKVFNEMKKDQEVKEHVVKTVKVAWHEKRASIRKRKLEDLEKAAAPPKKKAKKSVEPVVPKLMDDIEEVRRRARIALPEGTMEQHDLKKLVPPGCSIWNNWMGASMVYALGGTCQGQRSLARVWPRCGRAHIDRPRLAALARRQRAGGCRLPSCQSAE